MDSLFKHTLTESELLKLIKYTLMVDYAFKNPYEYGVQKCSIEVKKKFGIFKYKTYEFSKIGSKPLPIGLKISPIGTILRNKYGAEDLISYKNLYFKQLNFIAKTSKAGDEIYCSIDLKGAMYEVLKGYIKC